MKTMEIQQKIAPILKAYGIKRAALFGSVSRGDDRPDSDVDLLVKLGDQPMGMFKYMKFIGAMEEKLDRKVDVVTEGNLNTFLKPYILKDLKTIYEG